MTKEARDSQAWRHQPGPTPSTDAVEWARASAGYRVAVWSARLAVTEVPSLVLSRVNHCDLRDL
jgi:hypothetical protein